MCITHTDMCVPGRWPAAVPPAFNANWYFWQDGIAVGSGDFNLGWAASPPWLGWGTGAPDYWQNNEASGCRE